VENLQEGTTLQDNEATGPLGKARENLEVFADNLILQDSLRGMVEWLLVLKDVLKSDEISDLEREQTLSEIKLLEEAWSNLADSFREKGISA